MNRKKAGILFIVIGFIVFLGMISTVIILDYRRWALNLDGFQYKYASFANLLYSREKGAFLISLILGLLPISMGTILLRVNK